MNNKVILLRSAIKPAPVFQTLLSLLFIMTYAS